jgi:nucleoside-diphosphate-sugar epimerase
MRALLTGGCGDLGKVLAPRLTQRGDEVVLLDVRPPDSGMPGEFIHGSVLERDKLKDWFKGCDVVVHIAAWHGIHEFKEEKNAYDFFDLNVKGTFEVFEASKRARVGGVIFISSTSIDEPNTVYGHSKILAEQIASFYASHHEMRVVTLRPRAFIPYWNKAVYGDYIDWAKWFWKGAVHIDDVAKAVENSMDFIQRNYPDENLTLTVDGAYDYSDEDLLHWDLEGPGTTFLKHYAEFLDLAATHGLAITQRPRKLDISRTTNTIGYRPTYSLRNLLTELKEFGVDGPPRN